MTSHGHTDRDSTQPTPTCPDQLTASWQELGYRLVDDPAFPDGDRVPTVVTPGEGYYLSVWLYGDHRSKPLIILESPCAWPTPTSAVPTSAVSSSAVSSSAVSSSAVSRTGVCRDR